MTNKEKVGLIILLVGLNSMSKSVEVGTQIIGYFGFLIGAYLLLSPNGDK